MSRTACPAPAADGQLTIHHFVSGGLYTAREVAAFFRRSDQWVRDLIKAGRLSAVKLGATGQWVIAGESVRVLYGQLKLAEDLAGPPAAGEPEDRAVARELQRMAARNAKPKGKE